MREIKYLKKPDYKSSIKRNGEIDTLHYVYDPSQKLVDTLENKKYFIKTHGCQANHRDEETIAGILSSLKMKRTEDMDDADIICINTCSVRENANDKVYAELGDIKHLKAKKKDLILMVAGCMIETEDTLNKVINIYPHVDIIFGTHEINSLIKLLDEYITSNYKTRIVNVSSKEGEIVEDLPVARDNKFSAFVNISFGCDNFCTYCIVPLTRGKERSRNIKDIIRECELLKAQGYKEVTLLGQNVDSYGKDLNYEVTFANVLEEVAKIGIPRVRFLTSYPNYFKDDVIEVMKKYPNIMKYIHLPFQSGSNSVLKRMARRYTREEYLDLVNRIKKEIPDISFSTDIIVGFPNETEEEFADTVSLVKEVEYTSAFTFIYSPREKTPAARIEDKVDYKTKVRRFKELTSALEISIEKKAKELVGKTLPVLVTSVSKKDENMLTGTLENNKSVNFKGDPSLIGSIINVKIVESKTYSLLGEIVND